MKELWTFLLGTAFGLLMAALLSMHYYRTELIPVLKNCYAATERIRS